MTRTIDCIVLNRESEGLDNPPHPGELGQRVYEQVSKAGWDKWLEMQTMIINENGLNTADPSSIEILEKYMLGFFFKEGDFAQGFKPPGA